jgi:hypothetical protein
LIFDELSNDLEYIPLKQLPDCLLVEMLVDELRGKIANKGRVAQSPW